MRSMVEGRPALRQTARPTPLPPRYAIAMLCIAFLMYGGQKAAYAPLPATRGGMK